MKTLLALLCFISMSMLSMAKESIRIAPMKSVELTYTEFADFDVNLINNSGKPLSVAVLDQQTQKTVKSFGLGPIAKALLTVDEGQILKLTNESTKEINISLDFVKKKDNTYNPEQSTAINFTLHNSSLQSIPLIIPNVMNPNLSPLSNSGVSLEVGQEIFYKKGTRRILLLRVDETIQNGDKIDVAKLVRELDNL